MYFNINIYINKKSNLPYPVPLFMNNKLEQNRLIG